MAQQCPVCLESRSTEFGRLHDCDYRRCTQCRSVFAVGNVATPGAPNNGRGPAAERATERTVASRLRALAPVQGGRLLQVGCSTGDALIAARSLGWEVTGIESDAQAAAVGNSRLGTEAIEVTSLAAYEPPTEGFDAVVIFDVLDRVGEPRQVADKIMEALRPGGRFLTVLPDADSWQARLMGPRWPHFVADRRVLFSREALRGLLSLAGFYVAELRPAIRHVSVGMVRRHAETNPHVLGAWFARKAAEHLPDAILPMQTGEMLLLARSMGGRR